MDFRTISFLLAAVSSSAAIVPAHALVPGSDAFEWARDGATVRSVIEGAAGVASGSIRESRSYGFRNAKGRDFEVPGSERADDAADAAALRSVLDGIGRNASELVRAPVDRSDVLVPGSDGF